MYLEGNCFIFLIVFLIIGDNREKMGIFTQVTISVNLKYCIFVEVQSYCRDMNISTNTYISIL